MEWLNPEILDALDAVGFAAIALAFLYLFVSGTVVPGAQCDRRYADLRQDRDNWRGAYLALVSARSVGASADTADGAAALDALADLLREARGREAGA